MEEYKKMVLALPDEFFSGWEWKEGDKGILDGEEVLFLGNIREIAWYYGRGEFEFSINHIMHDIAMCTLKDLRPLPSQRQLQEKLHKHFIGCMVSVSDDDKYVYYYMLAGFEQFVKNTIEQETFDVMKEFDLDCLWLLYAMWLLYDKKWDGEKWIPTQ